MKKYSKKKSKDNASGIGCLILIGLAIYIYSTVNPSGNNKSTNLSATEIPTRPVSISPRTPLSTQTSTDVPQIRATSDIPQPTHTSRPALGTNLDNGTYTANQNVFIRSCAGTTCNNLGRITAGQQITVIGSIEGEVVERGHSIWYKINWDGGEAFVYARYFTEGTIATIPNTSTNSSNGDTNVIMPTSEIFVCPSNCTEARELGLNEFEIAERCPRLDRDNDGKACYNDN